MPKNAKPRGTRYRGVIIGKNTRVSDFHWLCENPKGHTRPVVRHSGNDGHLDPSRIRHAETRARRLRG